jgi:hypothetical protein
LNKKCIFKHYREFQARKTLLIDIIFTMKKISVDLFGVAPYMLMLVLHKDALFHYNQCNLNNCHLNKDHLNKR